MLPHLRVWLNHFEYHSQQPRAMPRGVSDVLPAEERRRIADSIATFQLGEQSAGSHLLRAAYRFAQRHDAAEVARITELLIREEQRHASLLREFMAAHAIAVRKRDWTDCVFRRVRRMAELELHLSVLLSAELIGTVYYRALELATGCQRLRLLCRMMVADELAHVGFESDLLLAMRAQRGSVGRCLIDIAHRAFFLGTAVVVWMMHRRVLRSAGGMLAFLTACRAQYAFYLEPPRVNATAPS